MLRLIVTFPEHGKAARDGAGWHVCLERGSRKNAAGPARRCREDRWRACTLATWRRLGPEASTIGPPS